MSAHAHLAPILRNLRSRNPRHAMHRDCDRKYMAMLLKVDQDDPYAIYRNSGILSAWRLEKEQIDFLIDMGKDQ